MEGKLIIEGGKPLKGAVEVRGSKNAATKMMVASLLTNEECVINNVPLSGDIDITKELCERIGSRISIDAKMHTCVIQTKTASNPIVTELSRRNRIPILALGPLLHRKGFAEIPVLGGCPIGHRPINFHLAAFKKMGAFIERRRHSYFAKAEKLSGADIRLPFPSVGATENILLAGALAKGKTHIRNAAVEPEIENLVEMLKGMGGNITFNSAKREILIGGVKKLHGVKASVMPDRNEVVSFAVAALATKGSVLIKDIKRDYLEAFLNVVESVGGVFRVEKNGIRFLYKNPYKAMDIITQPHPGFMTDWQQPFCVLLTQAKGFSYIHETVYEDRFGYTNDLVRMGADIDVLPDCEDTACRFHGKHFSHYVRIKGPSTLKGGKITMQDIRAGMAQVIAALAAKGESVVSGVEHIERGYENIDERLRELGAQIQRVKE